MNWLADYIGLEFVEHGRDFSGVDCWGLIGLLYSNRFGITLPDFSEDYCSSFDSEVIQGIMETESDNWLAVNGNDIQFGDVIELRVTGYLSHVGMVISPNKVIHIDRAIDSVIEPFDSMRWNRRLRGFYRHHDMKGITWEQAISAGA